MKFPIPNRKESIFLALIIVSYLIVYFIGIEERTHPDEYFIDFTTILAQPDHITCGPTSTTMILNLYGIGVDIDEVKKLTKTVWFTYSGIEVGMTSPDYIPIAMISCGVPAEMRYGNIDVLKHYISENKPCIALVRSGDVLWHYVVVYGYTQKKVYIADPGGGVFYDMDIERFENCWSWDRDMEGGICKNSYIPTLLMAAEVYPNTFICPDNPKP